MDVEAKVVLWIGSLMRTCSSRRDGVKAVETGIQLCYLKVCDGGKVPVQYY